ncbi:MAG TPA: cupin domain-containing protein [Anaerolineales bacterium]|nr:cupin domain-containing protein [Anaerolineales bacterium]
MDQTSREPIHFVRAGEDRFGEDRGLGITSLRYKVASEDSDGGLFIIEQTMHAPGGPPRHLHFDQEEWFCSLEGPFIVEIDQVRYTLGAGDSVLAPRKVPHTWAYVGDQDGRILIAFSPAGKMQAFFRIVTQANAMPPEDPELWQAHGMQLLGPPLSLE